MEGGSLDEGFNNRDGSRLNESQDSANIRPEVNEKPPGTGGHVTCICTV